MRKGHDNCWIKNNKDEVCGINLGADFTADHEWGIAKLKRLLKVPSEEDAAKTGKVGIERRRITKPEKECVALFELDDTLVMMIDSAWSLKDQVNYIKKDDGKGYRECWWRMGKDQELITAWSESDLGICVRGEENKKLLHELHDALLKGEVAIWLGGGGLLGNAGLCLAIIDKVNKENKDVMQKADEDAAKLKAAAEKTGIKAKIDAANEAWCKYREVETGSRCWESGPYKYYALSPSWKGSITKSKTKYPVIFWLNPANQDEINHGWFTVEELEQWLEGKGPIPMTQVERRKRASRY